MLLNDIKLVPCKDNNRFDIAVENYDLVEVTGLDFVRNGITMSLMTRENELGELMPNYKDFGSLLYTLIKKTKDNMTERTIEDYVKLALRKMEEISDIKRIEVVDKGLTFAVGILVVSDGGELIEAYYDWEM